MRSISLTAFTSSFLAAAFLVASTSASTVELNNQRYDGWTAKTTVPGHGQQDYIYSDQPRSMRLQVLHNNPELCAFNDDTSFYASRTHEIVLIMNGRGDECDLSSKLKLAEHWQPHVSMVFFYADDPSELTELQETVYDTTLRIIIIDTSAANAMMDFIGDQPAYTRFQGGPIAQIFYTTSNPVSSGEVPPSMESTSEPIIQPLGSNFHGGSVAGIIFLGLIVYVGVLHIQSQHGCCGGQPARVHPMPDSVDKQKPTKLSKKQTDLLVKNYMQKENGIHELSDRPCSICLDGCSEEIDPEKGSVLVIALPCGHRFHTDCIVPWLTTRKARCPMCNDDVDERVKVLEER